MGKVQNYYEQHFSELTEDKKFHFATRIKNVDYLNANKPQTPVSDILKNNDFSHVNQFEKRRPFFEKYQNLYAIEAALVRINHIKNLYGDDLRDDFTAEMSVEKLYELVDELCRDDEAIKVLSTYAINAVALTETLFPRQKNQLKEVAKKSLNYIGDPILLAYLYTHIIICATDFYYHDISTENQIAMEKVLKKAEEIIEKNYDEITMDLKLEFLVCEKLVSKNQPTTPSRLRDRIAEECDEILKSTPYITDSKKLDRYNTLDGAEHRNILYIMSGLDH